MPAAGFHPPFGGGGLWTAPSDATIGAMASGARGWFWLPPLLLVAGCATATHPSGGGPPVATPTPPSPPPSVPTPAPATTLGVGETGQASWYGEPHHGRPTASGEIYDMHDLTAAHRTLPLGTRVLVTNTRTGQATEVRINDRGPFKEGRVVDLSYAAALLLGAVGPGVIPVRVQVISLPEAATAGAAAGGRFAVQVGAFSSRAPAESLRRDLARDGVQATVSEASISGETYYRVRVGDYADRTAAHEAARGLAVRGRRAVIVER